MKILKSLLATILFLSFLTVKAEVPDSLAKHPDRLAMTDSLFKMIDGLHAKAEEVEHLSEEGFNLTPIKNGIPEIEQNIRLLQVNLKQSAGVMDMKSLQTFSLLLGRTHNQLDIWRKQLLGHSQQLIGIQTEIQDLNESDLLKNFQSDSLFHELYTNELKAIQKSWQNANSLNTKNLKDISTLQADVSRLYYLTEDLSKQLQRQIATFSSRIAGAEYPFIWKKNTSNINEQDLGLINASYLIQKQLIGDYLADHFSNHSFLGVLILVLFIYWIRKNFKKLKEAKQMSRWQEFAGEGYLSRFPFLPGLMVAFNASLFFDLNPPASYFNLLQLVLLILTSIFIFKNWKGEPKMQWLQICGAYIVFLFVQNILNPGVGARLAMLALNGFFIWKALYYIRYKEEKFSLISQVKKVSYVLLVVNILCIILNITGRVTLARMLSAGAILGFIQIISLSIFSKTMQSGLLLQACVTNLNNHGSGNVDRDKLNKRILSLLNFIVAAAWLIVFTSNMNVYRAIYESVDQFLFQVRTVGSTTFTIGNILLFFVVIFLSVQAQRHVGLVLGDHSSQRLPGEKKRGTRTVIVKLVIITLGFLIAIGVSGLPLDKVTVVLSAFGVGIGLGLQNIVNNFVSGIILIFERPLQIGDYVEVAGYKGWVHDIGIRATTLRSNEGSEIVVPNGTILSGNLVNWTLSNAEIKLEHAVKFSPSNMKTEAVRLVNEIICSEPNMVTSRPPEIFTDSMTEDVTALKAWFWIDNVTRQNEVKSNINSRLFDAFNANGIKMV
ncbi:MAG: mechanosensitive ion channel [Mucilaginibacter sp.]|nr:mechanosensitive ion channel [Mucilaginibacter sp.]